MNDVHATKSEAVSKSSNVRFLEEVGQGSIDLVGGKGAHLGELLRAGGIRVPAGFCVTTRAFERTLQDGPSLDGLLERLSRAQWEDQAALRALCTEVRASIEGLALPEVAAAIADAHARLGEHGAYAVRSSATAEDSPTASFAGQQDTYLNVVGLPAVLQHVRRCWASLFTERAVAYRHQNGLEHRKVQMAVVVQKMVFPEVAGVLFTSDPVTGNRKVVSVEATYGLGEAFVAGRVNADAYRVRDGAIVSKTIGSKQVAVWPSPAGGTSQRAVAPDLQARPALADARILELAELGRRIEAHFGCPQDIEWCLVDDAFHIVQSRPITTLYPIPASSDQELRVYVSVGHQQMMTDAMKPLGLSLWQLKTHRPMSEAGGRLFVDVTAALASRAGRAGLLGNLGTSDPLIGDALQTLIDRGHFVASEPAGPQAGAATAGAVAAPPLETDPALVAELIGRSRTSIAALERDIRSKSGTELLDFILSNTQELERFLFDPTGMQVILAGIEAIAWLNEHLEAWLGVKNAADTLTQSVPHNVTSEMGLALLDVADVIRRHPEVVAFLEHVDDEGFVEELPKLSGGREARDALRTWLDEYGMRGVGEIDVTRPRFRERPTMLVPMILGNVRNFAPGEAQRRFERGRRNASQLEGELLERLRALPEGASKAEETKRKIDRVRTFAGYREYPKYHWVSCDFFYKRALLEEAERLVKRGVLAERDDIFFLRFEELREVVRAGRADETLIRERKEEFRAHQALRPPRVMTSEGEVIAGAYRREDVPEGALVGLSVCSGVVEGRARVLTDVADAHLETGDVLVTASTDPSWTPLFVAIQGLVTEVGGLMTHGAVVAREYGLPAVVGVENATTLIKDGQRIRVHGTNGYVEILP